MITLLECNTVTDGVEVVNSTHADKAENPVIRQIAEAFPYQFKTPVGTGESVLGFNGRQVIGGDPESDRYKLFTSIVITDELLASLKAESDQIEADRLAAEKAEEDRFNAAVAKAVAAL